jgi:hypothetical protein
MPRMRHISRVMIGHVATPADVTAPGYSSGEIGTVGNTTVDITFSEQITGSNYATGVTIKKDGVSQTISSATRQSGNLVVRYVITPAVYGNEVITWEYVGATGNITDLASNALGNVSAQTVTNNIAEKVYYVSVADGDDAHNGLTQAEPFLTLAKVSGLTPNPGDAVKFKSGEIWKNQNLLVPSSGTPASPIFFGKYGAGANPIFDGSQLISSWALDSGFRWKATGRTEASTVYEGVWQNGVRLIRKTSTGAMVDGSFYMDATNDILYVQCTDEGDPNGKTMEFTSKNWPFNTNGKHDLVVDHIDTTKSLQSGFWCRSGSAPYEYNVLFTDCNAYWNNMRGFDFGGAKAGPTNKSNIHAVSCVAHDNMIEGFWLGLGTDISAFVSESYFNGKSNTAAMGYSSITGSSNGFNIGVYGVNCTVFYCYAHGNIQGNGNMGTEWEDAGTPAAQYSLFDSCRIEALTGDGEARCFFNLSDYTTVKNCTMLSTCSTLQLFFQGNTYAGLTGLTCYHNTFRYKTAAATNVIDLRVGTNTTFKNNIVWCDATSYGFYISTAAQTGWVSDYNILVAGSFRWGTNYDTFAQWQGHSGGDAHSVNTAPTFVADATDMHLQAGSAGINVGVTGLGILVDYDGVTRDATPDIGAFEYH